MIISLLKYFILSCGAFKSSHSNIFIFFQEKKDASLVQVFVDHLSLSLWFCDAHLELLLRMRLVCKQFDTLPSPNCYDDTLHVEVSKWTKIQYVAETRLCAFKRWVMRMLAIRLDKVGVIAGSFPLKFYEIDEHFRIGEWKPNDVDVFLDSSWNRSKLESFVRSQGIEQSTGFLSQDVVRDDGSILTLMSTQGGFWVPQNESLTYYPFDNYIDREKSMIPQANVLEFLLSHHDDPRVDVQDFALAHLNQRNEAYRGIQIYSTCRIRCGLEHLKLSSLGVAEIANRDFNVNFIFTDLTDVRACRREIMESFDIVPCALSMHISEGRVCVCASATTRNSIALKEMKLGRNAFHYSGANQTSGFYKQLIRIRKYMSRGYSFNDGMDWIVNGIQ